MTPLLTLSVARNSNAPWEIRNALDALWRDVPVGVLPTARLLAAELAANAVRNGEGKELRVSLLRRTSRLLVEVIDDGPGFEQGPIELVDTLTERWGLEDANTRIWFELPLES